MIASTATCLPLPVLETIGKIMNIEYPDLCTCQAE